MKKEEDKQNKMINVLTETKPNIKPIRPNTLDLTDLDESAVIFLKDD